MKFTKLVAVSLLLALGVISCGKAKSPAAQVIKPGEQVDPGLPEIELAQPTDFSTFGFLAGKYVGACQHDHVKQAYLKHVYVIQGELMTLRIVTYGNDAWKPDCTAPEDSNRAVAQWLLKKATPVSHEALTVKYVHTGSGTEIEDRWTLIDNELTFGNGTKFIKQ